MNNEADRSRFDDPVAVADLVAALPRPLLIGLDIDGVLSPLVDHADEARLLDGVSESLERVVSVSDVAVAAISGRSLASVQTFGLPRGVRLVGSHGMEDANAPMRPLDDVERPRLDQLKSLADAAANAAGRGAWVEVKSASVAVHVRTADPRSGTDALTQLAEQTAGVDGATSKPGSKVLELFARHASKGSALTALRSETGAAAAVFVGDDVTDEEAFAVLSPPDLAIKVGIAPTIASLRLGDPGAVLSWLRSLGDGLSSARR